MQTLGAHSVLQNQASLLHTAPGEGRVDARPQGTSTRWKKSQAEGASLPPPPGCSRVWLGRGAPGWVISTSGISGKPMSRRGPRLPGTGQMTAVLPPAQFQLCWTLTARVSAPPPRTCGDGAGIQHGGLCLAWVPRPAASL